MVFYSRLAVTNFKKNRNVYVPYLLSCTTIVSLFYMMLSIAQEISVSQFKGGPQVGFILNLSSVIAGIFSAVVIFYTNSFLIKQRKKELGLYGVLGMEKLHVAKVLFWEAVMTGGLSLTAGILSGILLSRLMFLILLNLLGMEIALGFSIPPAAVGMTILLFCGVFLLTLFYNFLQIQLSSPIVLLREGRQGEKEPKIKWLLVLLGVLTLGGGYGLALWVRQPSEALLVFFPAVLLVIAGTYFLFTAGSIALLKGMKKNRAFYYRPQNFISVSGMIYRMKRNAVGLSNICILSTCVLVTLSSTLCLYIGEEEILQREFLREVCTSSLYQEGKLEQIEEIIRQQGESNNVSVQNEQTFQMFSVWAKKQGDTVYLQQEREEGSFRMTITDLEGYSQITGQQKVLGPGEALYFTNSSRLKGGSLLLDQGEYRLQQEIPPLHTLNPVGSVDVDSEYLALILPDFERLTDPEFQEIGNHWESYNFDVSGKKEDIEQFCTVIRETLREKIPYMRVVKNIFEDRRSFYSVYGSLLFIGIFFIVLFMIATILIIYYKQISEGYEDHDRFQIMQKVGLSQEEVRQAIRKQILLVFFLPLLMAMIHIAVAFPVLCKMLRLFDMTNEGLFLLCTGGTILLFAVAYWLVYQLTARTYYRLVQIPSD